MIYTTLEQLSRYRGLSPALDTAIDYLASNSLSKLAPGRNEVKGDEVYINRFGYTTLPFQEAAWEGHKRYADLHVVLSGEERIGVSDAARLAPAAYEEASDFIGYTGEVDTWLTMRPGTVLILFPEDVHMVKVQLEGPCQVEKAVFKIIV